MKRQPDPAARRPSARALISLGVCALLIVNRLPGVSAAGTAAGQRAQRTASSPRLTPDAGCGIGTGDAARFLEQATFGPSFASDPSDPNYAVSVAHVMNDVCFEGWLQEQFNAPVLYPDDPSVPGVGTNYYSPWDPGACDDAAIGGGVCWSPQQPATTCTNGGSSTCNRDNYTAYVLQNQFFVNGLLGGDQLRQRLTWALTQIDVVSEVDIRPASWMVPYLQVFDRDAFGNYRQLLYDLTLNPAMGEYLNMRGNSKNNVNENYAREILQLFSIGLNQLNDDGTVQVDGNGVPIPTYDQGVITGFAHVFTGWNLAAQLAPGVPNYRDPMIVPDATKHDTSPQTVLQGASVSGDAGQELQDALDNIFNHPNIGPFISKQLIQKLVTSNPSPGYVQNVTAAFNSGSYTGPGGTSFGSANRGDMQAVIAAILLDPEARTAPSDPSYGHLREPALLVTNTLRAVGGVFDVFGNATTDFVLGDQFLPSGANANIRMDQDVFRPPTVFSYFPPDNQLPGSSLLAPEFAIQSTSTSLARINFIYASGRIPLKARALGDVARPAAGLNRARLSAPAQRLSSHNGKQLVPRAMPRPRLLGFEENQGQTDPRVRFLARGNGYTLFLSSEGATLRMGTAVMRLQLAAANRTPRIAGTDELVGKSHYFLGHDPAKWRTGILHYGRVKYRDVYPGVDLVFYGNQGRLEYDFLVQPSADTTRIRFELDGADINRVDEGGDLIIRMGGAEVRQARPVIYQEWGGRRHFLTGRYVVRDGHQIGFHVEAYRPDKVLVIDPVLAYSSFLGGSDLDSGNAVAVDASGNVYVAGQTASVNFPTDNPEQPANAGGSDAFVTKLDPTGALIFSSYLGGTGNENNFNSGVESSGVAVDPSGNVCLAGRTSSIDFPVVNAVQSSYGGGDYDAFVSKLSADGSALTYSSYFGGEANDSANGIAVDSAGAMYVTGGTRSLNDFPITSGAFQSFSGGQLDAYVAKIDPTQPGAASLIYSTYLGGAGIDRGTAVAVDSSGNAYVTGRTESPDFPVFNSFQPAYGGGADAFVTVLNASGTALIYSTFLGGRAFDVGNGVIVDSSGNAYIVGETASLDFPVTNGVQPANAGSSDAFVIELDPTGSLLLYGTYIGGSALDRGTGVALDSTGKIVMTGETSSDDFPIVGAFQTARGGGKDAFVARLDPSRQGATSLLLSSYLGGNADDVAFGVAVGPGGDGWVVGQTVSTNFPIVNAVQAAYGGGASDAFIARVASGTPAPDYTVSATPASSTVTPGGSATYTVTVSPIAGFTGEVALSLDGVPANATATFTPSAIMITDATAQTSVLAVNTTASTPTGTFPLSVTATSDALRHSSSVTLLVATGTSGADLSVTKSDFPNPVQVQTNLSYRISVVNQGPAMATGVQLSDTLPAVTFVSATATQGSCSGTSTVTCSIGTLAAGSSAIITIVVTPPAIGSISNAATVTGDQPDPNPANNFATVVTSVVSSGGAPADVLQHHRNPTRDGLYIDPLITQAAATITHRDLSFNAGLAGPIYAQPLYVNEGPNGTPAFIVATERNNVIAVAAADGSPIWLSNLGTPVPRAQLPCGNIDPLGITGTPVIDPVARAVYVAAMTTPNDGTTKQHQIFGLSLDDGSILPGWPVSVEGIAYGGATFDSAVQGQRDALLLNAGVLYVSYGGHFGDCGAYHGWVVAVPVDDPGSLAAWATSAEKGGVWAPGGLATDGQSVFAITGNTFGAMDWMGGEAIIRLGPGATFSGDPADYFAPSNWQQLDAADLDLGGSGPVLINVPGATPPQLVVALGKNGVAYLEDPGNLGGVGTGDGFTGEGLQSKLVSNGVIRNAAAAYTAPSGTYIVFNTNSGAGVGCPATTGNLVALKIGASAPPTIDVAWCANVPGRGSPIVTTSDGTSEPVVWAVSTETTNRLFAFNGETGEMLFSGGGPDEQMSLVRRFQTPIAVSGRIIVAADDQLFVFSTR